MDILFAVSPPGLEPFTAHELHHLGLLPESSTQSARSPQIGGIEFPGDAEAIYRANLHLRTASRVLLRLGEFHAAAFSELNRHARALNWGQYINPGQGVAVRVTCHKSRLYHSTAVAREVLAAINASLGKPVVPARVDDEQSGQIPQLVIVRLHNDQCLISIDTSGELLHRRGYRLATAKAPLRETLAAGLLLASGWDCSSPLLDPFCGSGTIAIEAALLAYQRPPGIARHFAFMDWPGFQGERWSTIHSTQSAAEHGVLIPDTTSRFIFASDRDAGAIRIAQANAERAGVAQYIEFSQHAVSAIEPVGRGWIVTNPPYGVRISENKDLRNLYAQFGKVIRTRCPGWQFTVMCSDFSLLRQLNIPCDTSLSMVNGGIPVRVARGMAPETTL
jgi:putative N6-adenine-specific DNA methylase